MVQGVNASATISNSGTIAEAGLLPAIYFEDGGTVTNRGTGIISGLTGVAIAGATGTVNMTARSRLHSRLLRGQLLPAGREQDLQDGGRIVNGGTGAATAKIAGGAAGIATAGGGATSVTNYGTISGYAYGVSLGDGGNIVNAASGLIAGNIYGVKIRRDSSTITNYGTIEGSFTGAVGLKFAGTANQNITLVNAGTIAGDGADAVRLGTGNNRVVVDPGAAFIGAVDAKYGVIGAGDAEYGVSTLELASAASVGTITGLGTNFLDFDTLSVDAGARWMLAGSNTIAGTAAVTLYGPLTLSGTLANSGTFTNAGSLGLAGSLNDTGTFANDGHAGTIAEPLTDSVNIHQQRLSGP